MMVKNSINRFTRVFPVPVTAFKKTEETDITKIAMVTILKTGMAIFKNSGRPSKSDKISFGKT
jgi:hypothetical protein